MSYFRVIVATALLGLSLMMVSTALADQSGAITGRPCKAIKDSSSSVPGCTSATKLDVGKNNLAFLIVDTLLFVSGIIAVIFALIGGIRYVQSMGDPTRVQGAKNTLLYAIIGLIITILAIPISGFVISKIGG